MNEAESTPLLEPFSPAPEGPLLQMALGKGTPSSCKEEPHRLSSFGKIKRFFSGSKKSPQIMAGNTPCDSSKKNYADRGTTLTPTPSSKIPRYQSSYGKSNSSIKKLQSTPDVSIPAAGLTKKVDFSLGIEESLKSPQPSDFVEKKKMKKLFTPIANRLRSKRN
eukprot:Sdes_comp20598_c1_seq1m15590